MAIILRNTFLCATPASPVVKPRSSSAPPCHGVFLLCGSADDNSTGEDLDQHQQQLRILNRIILGASDGNTACHERASREGIAKAARMMLGVSTSSAKSCPSANELRELQRKLGQAGPSTTELKELQRKLGQACTARPGLSRPASSHSVCSLGQALSSRHGLSRPASSNSVCTMTHPPLSRPSSSNTLSTMASSNKAGLVSCTASSAASMRRSAMMPSMGSMSTLASNGRASSSGSLATLSGDFDDDHQVVTFEMILEVESPDSNDILGNQQDLPTFATPPAEKSAETVVIQNVPRCYTYEHLIAELGRLGFATGTYDHLFLPTDSRTKTNGGFAFVSFVNARLATQCEHALRNHDFSGSS